MKANNDNGSITVAVSEDEAIVLLEWLHRFNEQEHSAVFEDQAEERLLFDLEAELEKVVSASFLYNYQDILLKAREKIRDKE
jgi:hypothetical protein